MLIEPLSHKLKCAYMGVSLGLAAVIVYMTFLIAHQVIGVKPMALIPISKMTPTSSNQ